MLNALCGRAYYGKVTGTIKINGNNSLIEEHKPVSESFVLTHAMFLSFGFIILFIIITCVTKTVGFVPQDDIVFPELTVRENLLYSGRLQLPAGTSEKEIYELADATMAALGLSRIAKSLVGDATRRGVSGGEKKRVNIGLELMKRYVFRLDMYIFISGCALSDIMFSP